MNESTLSNKNQPSSYQNQLIQSIPSHVSKTKPRQARHVLTEEQFQDTLSNIITRDYFPAIPSLQRDLAVLDRRKEGDMAGAVAVRRAARQLASHEEELNQIEKEMEEYAIQHNKGIRIIPRPLHRETVDGFHTRVTSEDNEEFERKMRKENQSRQDKMLLIYNSVGLEASKVEHKLRIMNSQDSAPMNHRSSLNKKDDEDASCIYASDQFNPPRAIVHVAGTSKDGQHSTSFTNSLFFTPALDSSTTVEESSGESAIAVLNYQSAMNDTTHLLMPPPTTTTLCKINTTQSLTTDSALSLTENLNGGHSQAVIRQQDFVEYVTKPMSDKEKRIVPSQTRFSYQTNSQLSHSLSCTIRDTLNYRADSWSDIESSDNPTDLDEPLGCIDIERRKRKRKLDRERNTFVAMTPLILPGQDLFLRDSSSITSSNDGNSSPIMTWGKVASTPMVVGGSSTSVSTTLHYNQNKADMKTFVFANEDPYEKMARLAEGALAKKAKRYKEAGTCPSTSGETGIKSDEESVISSSSRTKKSNYVDSHKKTHTPYAQSLLKGSLFSTNKSAITTPRSRSAFGTALRETYSSTPCSTRKDVEYKKREKRN